MFSAAPVEPDHNVVRLVAAADEAYAPGLAALGSSVLEHRPAGRPLEFYIFDGGLAPATRERLAASWTGADFALHWLPIDAALLDRCGIANLTTKPAAAATLVLHAALPHAIDRVLFLDADTLVLADLTPLWDAELGDYALGAVRDTMIPNLRDDWMPPEFAGWQLAPYFNAGVMLIDLSRWRREAIGVRAANLAQRYATRFWSIDQQALNCALLGRWQALPTAWNRMTHLQDVPSNRCIQISGTEFAEAVKRPRIAHFAGPTKPWHARCWDDRTPDFRRQLERTAWAGWQPPPHPLHERIATDLVHYPHQRFTFIRRGLRLARKEGLPRWPWLLAAVAITLRFPWMPLTYVARRVRLRRDLNRGG